MAHDGSAGIKGYQARVWVGNVGRYNEGHLVGEWVTLPVLPESLDSFLRAECGVDATHEEVWIQDFEHSGLIRNLGIRPDEWESLEGLNRLCAIARTAQLSEAEWDAVRCASECLERGDHDALANLIAQAEDIEYVPFSVYGIEPGEFPRNGSARAVDRWNADVAKGLGEAVVEDARGSLAAGDVTGARDLLDEVDLTRYGEGYLAQNVLVEPHCYVPRDMTGEVSRNRVTWPEFLEEASMGFAIDTDMAQADVDAALKLAGYALDDGERSDFDPRRTVTQEELEGLAGGSWKGPEPTEDPGAWRSAVEGSFARADLIPAWPERPAGDDILGYQRLDACAQLLDSLGEEELAALRTHMGSWFSAQVADPVRLEPFLCDPEGATRHVRACAVASVIEGEDARVAEGAHAVSVAQCHKDLLECANVVADPTLPVVGYPTEPDTTARPDLLAAIAAGDVDAMRDVLSGLEGHAETDVRRWLGSHPDVRDAAGCMLSCCDTLSIGVAEMQDLTVGDSGFVLEGGLPPLARYGREELDELAGESFDEMREGRAMGADELGSVREDPSLDVPARGK